jgi:hypothetical protein
MIAPSPQRWNAGMFIGDEVRAEVGTKAATTRLADLARGNSLIRASYAAWDAGKARTVQVGPRLTRLLRVDYRGPVQRGAVSVLILRWEAADGDGRPFAALDADITLVPDGEQATLVGLTGVYRTPAGTRPDRLAVHRVAAMTTRALLDRIADTISGPAAPPGEETGAASIAPGTLACTSRRDLLPRGPRRVGGQPRSAGSAYPSRPPGHPARALAETGNLCF